MTASDPFTAATPHFRRAIRLGASPLPLAAYEVASYPRPPRWMARIVGTVAFVAVVVFLLAIAQA